MVLRGSISTERWMILSIANASAHTLITAIAFRQMERFWLAVISATSAALVGRHAGTWHDLIPSREPPIRSAQAPDQTPFVIVMQPDGKILIGGIFTTAWWHKRAPASRGSIRLRAPLIPSM